MKKLLRILLILICTPILFGISTRILYREFQLYKLFNRFDKAPKSVLLSRARNVISHHTLSSTNQSLLDSTLIDLGYASFRVSEEKFDWSLFVDDAPSSVTVTLKNEDITIKVYLSYKDRDFLRRVTALEIQETTLKTWYEHFWMQESEFNDYRLRLNSKILAYFFGDISIYAFNSPEMETQSIFAVYDDRGMNVKRGSLSGALLIDSKTHKSTMYISANKTPDQYDIYAIGEQIARTFKFNDFTQEDLPMYRQKLKAKCLPVDHDFPKNETY